MKKRKLIDGREIDVRVFGKSWCGGYDEYCECYFPEDAKKERLEKIEELKKLIKEFELTGDKDSLEYAKEELKIAEKSYDNFCEFAKGLKK